MSVEEAPLVPTTSATLTGVPEPTVSRAVGTSTRTIGIALRSAAFRLAVEVPTTLVVLPFVLSTLSDEGYGVWATFASLLTLGGLLDAGIRVEVTRRVGGAHGAGDPEGLQRAVSEGITQLLALAAAVAVGGALLGPVVLGLTFPDGAPIHLGLLYAGVIGLLCLSVLSGALFGVLRGLQRPDVEAYGAVAGLAVTAISSVTLLSLDLGIWALYWAALLAYATRVAVQYAGLRRLVPGLQLRPGRLTPGSRRMVTSLSGLALLTQVPEVVNAQWDKLVVSHYVGSEAVTQYELGSSLGLQARALALLPLLPLLAAMSELRERDPAGRDELFERLSRVSASVGSIVLLGVAAFAPAFFRVWLDDSYGDAATAARLIALGMLVGLVGAPWASYALAERWHHAPAASAVTLMVVNALVTLALVPRLDFLGAVIGAVSANVAGVALLYVLVRRRRARAWLGPAARPVAVVGVLAAAATAAGSAAIDSRALFVVAIAAFVAVAGGVLAATGDLRPRELAALVRR